MNEPEQLWQVPLPNGRVIQHWGTRSQIAAAFPGAKIELLQEES